MCSLLHSLVEYELHIALYSQAAAHCQSLVGSQRVAHLQCGTAVQCHLACQRTLTSQCSAALHCHCAGASVVAVDYESTFRDICRAAIDVGTFQTPVASAALLYSGGTNLSALSTVVNHTTESLVSVGSTYDPRTTSSILYIEA